MACCVPGCINQFIKWTVEFPRDKQLLDRWNAAIEAGTGECPSVKQEGSALICDMHFVMQYPALNVNGYREPTVFVRDNVLLQVASCRLCLRFDTTECMFNTEHCLVKGLSLQSMASKYFRLLLPNKEQTEVRYYCERCAIRFDMMHTFWQEISDCAKAYKKVLRRMAKEKAVFRSNSGDIPTVVIHDTVQVKREIPSPSESMFNDGDSGQVVSIDATVQDVIVKEETQLAAQDSPRTDDVSVDSSMAEQIQQTTDESQSEQVPSETANKTQFKCFICNTAMESKESQIHHLMIDHSTQEPYRCEECNLSFKTTMSFNIHLSAHDAERPLKCSVCSMRFMRKITKLRHEAALHGVDHGKITRRAKRVKRHPCATCGKTYFNRSELVRHERVQHQGGAHTRCEICNEAFSSMSNLQRHILTHQKEQPYKCDFCSVSYRQQHQLTDHIREKHDSNQPISLSDSTAQSPLVSGKPLVTRIGGESRKVPTCNICQAAFKHPKEVVTHFKEDHPDVELKYYPCPLCDDVFFLSQSLYSHRYNKHSDLYACDLCGKRHPSRQRLAMHRQAAHGEAQV